jgi:hypothetical protein
LTAFAGILLRVADAGPRQVDLGLIRPGDHGEEDAALGPADDGLDDAGVFQRLRDAFHLQLVARVIDRVRDVDRDDEGGVDLVRRLGRARHC